jgi:hypothetical protein
MKKIVVLSILVLLSQAMMNPDVFSDEHLPEHTVARSNGFDPIANVSVSANHDGAKKVVDGTEWNIYEITLPEDGAIYVNFDASGSYDPGASNPLELYQWKVFFDQPHDDDNVMSNGHTFNETQASNGLWSYVFQNITTDESDNKSGVNQIRVELTVADYEGNTSEKFRMYFVVVPEAADSDEPNIQFDIDSNGTEPSSEYVYVNGTVLSGAGEEGDVIVEIAFEEDHFNGSAVEKYNSMQNDTLDRVQEISDGDAFVLTLSIESLMCNTAFNQTIYIKIEELHENGTVQYSTILENYSVVVPAGESDENCNNSSGNNTVNSNTAPVVSNVIISPEEALQNDELTCSYDVYDADGDTMDVNVTWLVNGVLHNIDWQSNTLSSAFSFEDEVECSVTASDGQQTSNAVNYTITILPASSFESNDDDDELPALGAFGTMAAIVAGIFASHRKDE